MGKLRDKAFVNVLATPTSFFKIKNGYLRKSQKTELATKLKKPLKESYSATLPTTDHYCQLNVARHVHSQPDMCQMVCTSLGKSWN